MGALIAFIPALNNDFVRWDDYGLLLTIEGWRGLGLEQLAWMFTTNHFGHYQPITWLTYGVDYVIWGIGDDGLLNPTGFHLTNNLFHAANTLLVYFVSLILLRRAFEGRATSLLHLGALLATLLFALHPLRVESVAWVTERRDLVSAFFLLLTVLTYLKAAAPGQTRRWVWLGVALGIYLISMVSKVGGAPLPVVLLVLDWYPLRRLGPTPRHWFNRDGLVVAMEKIPFLIIAVGLSIVTIVRQTGEWLYTLEHHGLAARTAQACYGLVFYVVKTLVPTNLLPLYELHTPLDLRGARFILAAAVVLLAAIAAWMWRKRCPGLIAAALCYALMLGPVLGFFQNGPQLVADRYSYLACLGGSILAAGGLIWLLNASPKPALRLGAGVASVGVVAALGTLTWRQCNVWENSTSLWTYMVERAPDSAYANNNFATVLMRRGEEARALPYLRRAVEINSRNIFTWRNLWRALEQLGHEQALTESYQDAIGNHLGFVQAQGHFALGLHAYRRGDYEASISHYGTALTALEDWLPVAVEHREFAAEIYNQTGIALQRAGRAGQSEAYYRRAVELDPDLLDARLNLAGRLRRRGRHDEALDHVAGVLQRRPDDAVAAQLKRKLEVEAGLPP